jgi:hypothetical protein
VIDAGGGSLSLDGATRTSAGMNSFSGNRSATDSTLDVHNLGTSLLKAESNWWGDLDPSNQVSGSVDFTPWLTESPQPGQGPEAPSNLQRTDVRP